MTNGLHNLKVYANDAFGDIGTSKVVSFAVAKPEPFQTAVVFVVSIGKTIAVGRYWLASLLQDMQHKNYAADFA